MDLDNIVKSLNLTDGDMLTLEKAKDRTEFEALPVMAISLDQKAGPCSCWAGWDGPCDCKGPVGYFNCRPFTECPSNN